MGQSRINRRMAKRLTDSAKNRKSYKENQKFLGEIGQENQLLNAMVIQKNLIKKIKGNWIQRYINWWMNINPMLKIMYDRETLLLGHKLVDPESDKGGDNHSKADSSG